jgi:hypothetical protein
MSVPSARTAALQHPGLTDSLAFELSWSCIDIDLDTLCRHSSTGYASARTNGFAVAEVLELLSASLFSSEWYEDLRMRTIMAMERLTYQCEQTSSGYDLGSGYEA